MNTPAPQLVRWLCSGGCSAQTQTDRQQNSLAAAAAAAATDHAAQASDLVAISLSLQVWEGNGVVASARKLIGATNPLVSEPGTIRGDFAIEVGQQWRHGIMKLNRIISRDVFYTWLLHCVGQ